MANRIVDDGCLKPQHQLFNVEAASLDTEKLREENRALQAQVSGKENEMFEINFEIKGMQSKLKLLETERCELQASFGEVVTLPHFPYDLLHSPIVTPTHMIVTPT